ncbi:MULTISPECIES: hypothetical protein [unclassified Variovorax]|uniref:hypothetical protein n=1 Tax=unclassified Variovorax TaxID=663243 RepID=UPI001318D05F|nr:MULTISPECIES: hypothetical protein [unclassified Variovorax]VTU43063.1 hypothetical protein SRS16P1_00427 [Variovorax sp. SRS16]VTU43092.1 hypothetical protein E5P1_00424 [Variovorax sp. PBL-E5]VTU43480.1 hypothetical protein H6P1_00479 [Variovorax sp. PBL-H6]
MTKKFIVTYRPPEHAGKLIAVEHESAETLLETLLPAAVSALQTDNGPFELFGKRFDVEALMVWVPDDPVRHAYDERRAKLEGRPAPVRYEDSRGLMRRYVAPKVEALDDWFDRIAKAGGARSYELERENSELMRAEA